jgi:hypothetical protein
MSDMPDFNYVDYKALCDKLSLANARIIELEELLGQAQVRVETDGKLIAYLEQQLTNSGMKKNFYAVSFTDKIHWVIQELEPKYSQRRVATECHPGMMLWAEATEDDIRHKQMCKLCQIRKDK